MPRYTTPRSLFGRRLREARLRTGMAQDKLGVAIGIDEMTSSARISRYENGTHEPPFRTAEKLAAALNVPTAYFYCEDDELARLICRYALLPASKRDRLLRILDELVEGAN